MICSIFTGTYVYVFYILFRCLLFHYDNVGYHSIPSYFMSTLSHNDKIKLEYT